MHSPREVSLSIFPSQVMPWKVTDIQQIPDQGMPLKGETSNVKNIPLNTEEMLYKMEEIMHGPK